MERDAIRLAQFVGYRGAGTIEYLYDPQDESYFFLEMNPRLQVEHPATELVTGVNVVAVMLQIMMGIPLFNIPEIKEFYKDGKAGFGLDQRKPPNGHVIATRITSEDAKRGFQPGQGRLYDFFIPSHPLNQIFAYFSLYPQNSSLHQYADSQFGHVFSHSKRNRNEARLNLISILMGTRITSEFNTNLESLISILYKEEFIENDTSQIDTQWLDRIIADSSSQLLWTRKTESDLFKKSLLGGIYISHFKLFAPSLLHFKEKAQSGFVPLDSETVKTTSHTVKFHINATEVKCRVSLFDPTTYRIIFESKVGTESPEFLVKFRELPNSSLLVQLNDNRKCIVSSQPQINPDMLRILIDNDGEFEVKLRSEDPRHIISPSSGRIVRYLVQNGDTVQVKTPIVEIEASLYGENRHACH